MQYQNQTDEQIIIDLTKTREERERREARDRVLAREVGIEIGRRREAMRHEKQKHRQFTIGLFVGMLIVLVTLATMILSGTADAKPKPIITTIGTGADAQRVVYELHKTDLPPAWRTWLRICQAEQPARGWGWAAVAWTNTKNHSFPGGCGLTRANYDEIKHAAWPETMNLLTPRDQLWACFFLYWKHARIGEASRGYTGGQRYGSTVWDVRNQIGFYGFHADGETRA